METTTIFQSNTTKFTVVLFLPKVGTPFSYSETSDLHYPQQIDLFDESSILLYVINFRSREATSSLV